MPAGKTPVVFVLGLWLHRSSWTAWAELFTAQGHAPKHCLTVALVMASGTVRSWPAGTSSSGPRACLAHGRAPERGLPVTVNPLIPPPCRTVQHHQPPTKKEVDLMTSCYMKRDPRGERA